jgi:hypothetical protein
VHVAAVGGLLVGLGSVLGLLPRVLWPARPAPGITFGTLTNSSERVRFAVETTGLTSAAVGSVILVLVDLVRWLLIVGILGAAALLIWAVAAHKLRQLWMMRARASTDELTVQSTDAPADLQRSYALSRTQWTWCVRRAFARDDPWPPTSDHSHQDVKTSGLRPVTSVPPFEAEQLERRHISALRTEDARLADLAIPARIRSDLVVIREQGFEVRLDGDLLIVTAPDGRTSQAVRSTLDSNSVTAVAARELFLRHCEEIGVTLRSGARGQSHPAGGVDWRLPDSTVGKADTE